MLIASILYSVREIKRNDVKIVTKNALNSEIFFSNEKISLKKVLVWNVFDSTKPN